MQSPTPMLVPARRAWPELPAWELRVKGERVTKTPLVLVALVGLVVERVARPEARAIRAQSTLLEPTRTLGCPTARYATHGTWLPSTRSRTSECQTRETRIWDSPRPELPIWETPTSRCA